MNSNVKTLGGEQPCGDACITAVVAGACEDEDANAVGGLQTLHEVGRVLSNEGACVFHQEFNW